MIAPSPTQCPLCGAANSCRVAEGCLYKGACWCEEASVPAHVLRHLAEGPLASACFCRRCLTALAQQARKLDDPAEILARVREEVAASDAGQDFYHDELGRVVFTAAYHGRRGSCCGSGCRHCPYPDAEPGNGNSAPLATPR